ncbi:hypothetical protein PIB30_054213 [Stylosanthes scabra]|uniref:Uncharacterized protein n=1 Tax=Stylosanthes scabra TaxID=79078 RepID=A0ABU6TJY0_9FABA|nr:hypothetical protein [Stylosanthes scabra]
MGGVNPVPNVLGYLTNAKDQAVPSLYWSNWAFKGAWPWLGSLKFQFWPSFKNCSSVKLRAKLFVQRRCLLLPGSCVRNFASSSEKKEPFSQDSSPSRRSSPISCYSPFGPVTQLGSPSSSPNVSLSLHGHMDQGKKSPTRVDDAEGDGMEEEEQVEEEKDLEEDTLKEEMSAIPRPMDVEADEDYLQYFEDL